MMKRVFVKTLLLTAATVSLAATPGCDMLFGSNGDDDSENDAVSFAGRWVGAEFDDEEAFSCVVAFNLEADGSGCTAYGPVVSVDGETLYTEFPDDTAEYELVGFPEGIMTLTNPEDVSDERLTKGRYELQHEPTAAQEFFYDELDDEIEVSDYTLTFSQNGTFTLSENDNELELQGDFFALKRDQYYLAGLFPTDNSSIFILRVNEHANDDKHGWLIDCKS